MKNIFGLYDKIYYQRLLKLTTHSNDCISVERIS